jgi:fermentation-respiration switch protein FrsA (DUF1100 family)
MRGFVMLTSSNAGTSGRLLDLRLMDEKLIQVQGHLETLVLDTDGGEIQTIYHHADGPKAVIWVGGAGGGLDGPAQGLYPRISEILVRSGISSLRMNYRVPNDLTDCTIDILLCTEYLNKFRNKKSIILAGHSFGGAVVISASVFHPAIKGIIAISSQTYGTSLAGKITPRSLLLVHGIEDEILPADCSKSIYKRARNPKKLILYPGAKHGLDEVIPDLDRDLVSWIKEI